MADLELTLTIPEEHIATVKEAFDGLVDRQLEINTPGGPIGGNSSFTIVGQVEGETAINYGKRFVMELLRGAVRCWKDVKYNTAVAAARAVIEETGVVKETVIDEVVE